MVFNSNYGAGTVPTPAAILVSVVVIEFIPVCGAMRRNHLTKE